MTKVLAFYLAVLSKYRLGEKGHETGILKLITLCNGLHTGIVFRSARPNRRNSNRLQCPLSFYAPTLEVGIFEVTLVQITIGITDSRRVGQNLLVRAVAAGEMIRRNDELLLHVELIDVGTGTQLWGAQFKEPYSDVLAHTEKLADEICHQLRLVLAPNIRTRGREPPEQPRNWG